MALNYGDNYVHIIKKNDVEYNVKDAIAAAAIDTIQGDENTNGSILKAAKDAKTYSKDLIDKVLGADSAAQTITNLQNVLNELNDPDNQQGIPGTFVDTVKAGLAGLGNKTEAELYADATEYNNAKGTELTAEEFAALPSDQKIKTPAVLNTVKDYVDAAVQNASSDASGAIQALDAEVPSSDGTNVQVKVTEVDGVITAVNVTDNSINATDLSNKVGDLGNTADVLYADAAEYNEAKGTNLNADEFAALSNEDKIKTAGVAHTVKSYVDTKFSDSAFTITDHILELGL